MKKFKLFFINIEKEEKWLNDMLKSGWLICGRKMNYEFCRTEEADSLIRIDYRTFKNREEFDEYRTLFYDSGWQHMAGSKNSGTQYFRRMRGNSEEHIFSDTASKAGRYKRLSDMWLMLAIIYIPIIVVFLQSGAVQADAVLNPKLLYYTPGLWEMSGAEFWQKFLFETPFALFRGFIWLLLPAIVIFYIVFAVKAHRQYKREKGL